MKTQFALITSLTASLALNAGTVVAQHYPSRPLRIITSEPGGSSDFIARLIAQGITGPLGQPVVVDNRGGGVIPAMTAAAASPDGHTLFVMTGVVWVAPLLQTTPYDPVKDLAPVTLAVNSPNILVVHPGVPVNSVKELIALAKAKPGELNYGSGATGSASHIATELFKTMADVKIVRIPYKGAGPAVNALIAAQVQMMIATSSSVAPHIKSEKLRALAITSTQPSKMFPGLPTVTESGLRGYASDSVMAVFVPARTPAPIIDLLNQEIIKALKRPETQEKLFSAGLEVLGTSPALSVAKIKADMVKLGKLIKDAGIRAE